MHGVGPGSVLGGRYAVTLRTSEGTHHERWRASDQTLEREVVLVCFRTSSTIAPAVLDAARRAAGIEDPRLVRVLDVGSGGDVSFIVEEPLTGAMPMSHLLQTGGLPAEEVRRLIGEAASALDKARHRGLHHLALTPSAVLRMPDGEVKVRGLATEAALTDADRVSEERASRVDAIGLVKLTYAGLTGRWPTAVGVVGRPVGLEPAPTVVGGVAAPSEIAVGVPNDLDLICRMTLNEDRGPLSPGDLALQIAPWPAEQPLSDGASGIRLPPTREELEPTQVMPTIGPGDPATSPRPGGLGAGAVGGRVPGVPRAVRATGAGASGAASGAAAGAAAGAAQGGATAGTEAGRSAGAALASAGSAAAGVASALGDRVGSFARAAADKAAARTAERRGAHDSTFDGEDIGLNDALDEAPTTRLEPPLPVFGSQHPESPSGAQSRIALAIVGALVLVALVIGINNVAKIGEHDGAAAAQPTVTVTRSRPAPSTTEGTTSTPPATRTTDTATGGPVAIAGGRSFDPEDDGEESPSLVPLAFDGDPSTYWKSRWYGSDTYNQGKAGVGVVLDLTGPTVVKEVDLTLPQPQDVTVYLTDSDSLEDAQEIGSTSGEQGTVTVKAESGLEPGTKLIVWVTKPAPDEAPNHFRAQISEVAVR